MNNILVTNRDGDLEPVNIRKIQKKTLKSCYGLSGTDSAELELDAQLEMFSGINTSDIQKTFILTAVNKIDIDTLNDFNHAQNTWEKFRKKGYINE